MLTATIIATIFLLAGITRIFYVDILKPFAHSTQTSDVHPHSRGLLKMFPRFLTEKLMPAKKKAEVAKKVKPIVVKKAKAKKK